jgi:hypothetical protein
MIRPKRWAIYQKVRWTVAPVESYSTPETFALHKYSVMESIRKGKPIGINYNSTDATFQRKDRPPYVACLLSFIQDLLVI